MRYFNLFKMKTFIYFFMLIVLVNSVTIESQVTIIKNDCFERQAIGHRLRSSDIYKMFDVNTVPECQRECTKEEDTCKSFSFGIGVKGNASCELSKKVIRETADLKPIGTVLDEDFDLYIKKLGCKLVIEQKPSEVIPQSDELPSLSSSNTFNSNSKPKPSLFDSPKPDYYGNQNPSPSSTLNSNHNTNTNSGYDTSNGKPQRKPHGNIQTSLIAVRPDPSRPGYTGLSSSSSSSSSGYDKPVNEPLNERPYYGENPERPNRPNNRPPGPLSSYYVNEVTSRPGLYTGQASYGPQTYDRPNYDRPTYDRPPMSYGSSSYGSSRPPLEPIDNHISYNRPDVIMGSRPDFRPGVGYYRPIDPMMDEFRPHFDNLKPESWGGYERPDPMRDPMPEYEYGLGAYGSGGYNEVPRPRPEYDRPERPPSRPSRPTGYYRPLFDDRPERPGKPGSGYDMPDMEFSRPGRPQYEYGNGPNDRPSRPSYIENNRPFDGGIDSGYGLKPQFDRPANFRPPAGYEEPRPPFDFQRPMRPNRPEYGPPLHDFERPEKPMYEERPNYKPNWDKDVINQPYDSNNPNVNYENVVKPVTEEGYGNRRHDLYHSSNGMDRNRNGTKPIVSQSVGPNGEKITSIITEIKSACFRRALAGKRVTRSLVRRALSCGRVEDCQQECQDEKRFVCEGFNYRLDPTGRSNGDCELLDLPMVRVDMIRDVYPDPDYDIYEKDRNGYPDCKSGGYGYGFGDRDRDRDRDPYADRRHDTDRRRPYDDRDRPEPRPESLPRPIDQYHRYRDRYDERRRPAGYLPDEGNRRLGGYDDGPRRGGNNGGGGGGDYHHRPNYDYTPHRDSSPSYIPLRPGSNSGSYLPDRKYSQERDKDRHHWGLQDTTSWGTYGGSYGHGHPDRDRQRDRDRGIPAPYDIPVGDTYAPKPSYDLLPKQPNDFTAGDAHGHHHEGGVYGNAYGGSYGGVSYGSTRPTFGIVIPINSNSFGEPKPTYGTFEHSGYDYPNVPITENHFPSTNGDTVEHKDNNEQHEHTGYNFLKEECSLRSATGFRLHKIIVKKYYSVPDIYECETLCFKEKDFKCSAYAYRYTLTSSVPTDNCYLSDKNYKQLDFYTDLEPDRDFDIYTMNNRKKCEDQIPREKEHSECFWHTRSGQRLDQKIVREATMVKTIVECQIACLRANKYLCRGFSFRYGSAVIGGPVENCLLTDWPFKEIDPNTQFASELGFEIYERGSFGHGCEPNHFAVRGKEHPVIGSKTDQLCYVGYGTPARLLPEAIRKSSVVSSELDCKTECTKYRHSSLFQCMSFSYKSKTQRGEPNCYLSDILQRDLLSAVDYVADRDAWLFAWDNYNPECVSITGTTTTSTGSNGGYHGYHNSHGHGVIPHRDHGSSGLIPPRERPLDHEYVHGRDDSYDMDRYKGPITALDTWRVYSVSGWPCRRGSLCRENREAGFWYCDLEGGDRDTWDYCCRPDHQCGYSEGFNYQWCYVGPERTQWRKCSERYYPYVTGRREKPYLPSYNPSYDPPPAYADGFLPTNLPRRPPFRPNRPLQRPRIPPSMPSLNEYENEFNKQFLDPPKPGGFGQPRLWPVSYLHRELPPEEANSTEYKYDQMKDGRITAIHNLISIIKSNNLNDIKYEINNDTNLLIQVPLPGNFTKDGKPGKANGTMEMVAMTPKKEAKSKTKGNLEEQRSKTNVTTIDQIEMMDSDTDAKASEKSNVTTRHVRVHQNSSRTQSPRIGRSRQLSLQDITRHLSTQSLQTSDGQSDALPQLTVPTYKKSYIVRTNKTDRSLVL